MSNWYDWPSDWLEEGEENLYTQFENAEEACKINPYDVPNLRKLAKAAIGLTLTYSHYEPTLGVAKVYFDKVVQSNQKDKDIDIMYYLGMLHAFILHEDISQLDGKDDDYIETFFTDGYNYLKAVEKYVEEHAEEQELSELYKTSELLRIIEEYANANDIDLPDKPSSLSSSELDDKTVEDMEFIDRKTKSRAKDKKNRAMTLLELSVSE